MSAVEGSRRDFRASMSSLLSSRLFVSNCAIVDDEGMPKISRISKL